MAKTISIVEDDAVLRDSLAEMLESHGFETLKTVDFSNAAQKLLEQKPDLILLDLKLPQTDGVLIAKEIKAHERGKEIPIIVLTSKTGEADEIVSMSMGADDFIAKPFSPGVLLAHIEAVLRRYNLSSSAEKITCKKLVFFPAKGTIETETKEDTSPSGPRELTRNEQRILLTLLKNEGKIVSRQALMMELWDSDEFVDDNTLTVNINRLRKSLEAIGLNDFIKTHRSQGYSV